MAGPSRLFTVSEANATLPELVPRIARLRIVRDEARRVRELLEVLWQRLDDAEPVLSTIGERQAALDALRADFARLLDEIDGFGVILRDLDLGLLDFPARVRGMPIYLCWREGEAQVAYWHGVSEGFAGRRSITMIRDQSHRTTS
ncbi:MAG: DUF2203 domain-containing protein [Armatimonadota bacterium]